MKNYLNPSNGISTTQAQIISNLCNQKAKEIDRKLNNINNFSSKVTIDGKDITTVDAYPIPKNVLELVKEKSEYHALQGFLMENIKAKENLLKKVMSDPSLPQIPSDLKCPTKDKLEVPNLKVLKEESWGWEQLTREEILDYRHNEAIAAHLGQFFHKDGILDNLRNELPNVKRLTFMGGFSSDHKLPVISEVHHTGEELMNIHELFYGEHRVAEQKVNYYKSKVKNLVATENAKIEKENAIELGRVNLINDEINLRYKNEMDLYKSQITKFEAEKSEFIHNLKNEYAKLRIEIPEIYKSLVNSILPTLGK